MEWVYPTFDTKEEAIIEGKEFFQHTFVVGQIKGDVKNSYEVDNFEKVTVNKMIGKKLVAARDMIVNDIEDGSLGPIHIVRGDTGVITGIGDYPNGRAYEIRINGHEIFSYRLSSRY
ncbi:hypothetical protein [Metabacillus fastidiosus]|uniref:hypothetical protein n=1 Tax=Metabacillus fastidiosus TaxID=1458 RepID=UPI003D280DD5